MAARERARNAASLEELRARPATFSRAARCARRATQLVFADGNPAGRVMFVGEAPGRDEDSKACRSSGAPGNFSTA